MNSMIILIGYMTQSEELGGKVLLALDICQIYDEEIEERYIECGGTQAGFIEYLNERMSNL